MKKAIDVKNAPAPIGPYSRAIVHNGIAYLSGQVGLDPETGALVEGIEAQTARVLDNLGEVLKACGSSYDKVLKTTVFMADMTEFGRMNAVYGRYFQDQPPARSTVQAARLPRDARVEIDCIAAVSD